MLFNEFDHTLIEAWLERQLAKSLTLIPATTWLRRIGRIFDVLDRNHASPLCVARVREEHHQAVVG